MAVAAWAGRQQRLLLGQGWRQAVPGTEGVASEGAAIGRTQNIRSSGAGGLGIPSRALPALCFGFLRQRGGVRQGVPSQTGSPESPETPTFAFSAPSSSSWTSWLASFMAVSSTPAMLWSPDGVSVPWIGWKPGQEGCKGERLGGIKDCPTSLGWRDPNLPPRGMPALGNSSKKSLPRYGQGKYLVEPAAPRNPPFSQLCAPGWRPGIAGRESGG